MLSRLTPLDISSRVESRGESTAQSLFRTSCPHDVLSFFFFFSRGGTLCPYFSHFDTAAAVELFPTTTFFLGLVCVTLCCRRFYCLSHEWKGREWNGRSVWCRIRLGWAVTVGFRVLDLSLSLDFFLLLMSH